MAGQFRRSNASEVEYYETARRCFLPILAKDVRNVLPHALCGRGNPLRIRLTRFPELLNQLAPMESKLRGLGVVEFAKLPVTISTWGKS